MPKIKTKRGAAKRFKVTATGKVKKYKSYRRHILTSKPSKRKRRLRKADIVNKANIKMVKRLIPYGGR